MKERILCIMREKSLSASSLAEIIGVQASGISHILSGRNNPSFDFITRVLTNFPDINPDWFILGKGDMYRIARSSNHDNCGEEEMNKHGGITNETNSHAELEDGKLAHDSTTFSIDRNKVLFSDTKGGAVPQNNPFPSLFDSVESLVETAQSKGNKDSLNCNINMLTQESDPGEVKKIRRVMIFFSDHTVDSYDYCDSM